MTNYTPRRWQIRAMLDGTLSTLVVPLPKVPRFSPEFERQWHCNAIPHSGGKPGEWGWWNGPWHGQSLYHTQTLPLPLGKPVWVREPWAPNAGTDGGILYKANHGNACGFYQWDLKTGEQTKRADRWRSPVTMPRWASRLTLVASEARVCRVQDVTREEARACGLRWEAPTYGVDGIASSWNADPRDSLAALWIADHGPDSWSANPWVQIARVQIHHTNIDKLKAEEDAA